MALHHSRRDPDFLRSMLLSGGPVPVDPTALVEAMTHHSLGKLKKGDCQNDYQHEFSNSERGGLSSCRGRRIRRSCHLALGGRI